MTDLVYAQMDGVELIVKLRHAKTNAISGENALPVVFANAMMDGVVIAASYLYVIKIGARMVIVMILERAFAILVTMEQTAQYQMCAKSMVLHQSKEYVSAKKVGRAKFVKSRHV